MNRRVLGISVNVWGVFFALWFLIALYLSYRQQSLTWVTWLEIFAVITGALGVWLVIRENVWNWLIGIFSSASYIVVFWKSGLPSDMGLQVVYVILGFLGWYHWLYGGQNRTELKVYRTPTREIPYLILVGLLGTALLWKINVWVHGASPFWDALLATVSLIAQYLVTRKYLENWHLWILVDLIYIPLYISRGLQVTAVLYALFTCMAFLGLQEWKDSMQSSQLSSLNRDF